MRDTRLYRVPTKALENVVVLHPSREGASEFAEGLQPLYHANSTPSVTEGQ